MLTKFRARYLGDAAFYRLMLTIAIPLVIQQGITSFVSLLDNLMVGALGEMPLSGVSIVNQCINVFNLTLFGGLSAASIFGAQFFGVGDWRGMRDTFRFRVLFGAGVTAVAVAIFLTCGDRLALLFLENDNNSPAAVAETLEHAMAYLRIAVWGLIPFFVSQVYTGLLRETGETLRPMIASVIAIFTNLILNYVLIFGHLGLPAMGAEGAALATVIARVLEAGFLALYTHTHADRFPFIRGAFASMRVPAALCRRIVVTGTPLLINEMLWSLGMTTINAAYAFRGLEVVAATNISTTVWNLFWIIAIAMGSVTAILVGRELGAGNIEGARTMSRRILFFTLVLHLGIAALLVALSPFIPMLYDVSDTVRDLAASMLRVQALMLPVNAYIHVAYFTIRSGGKTVITFLFDAVYTWCVPVVLSFVLCRLTALPILACFAIVQGSDIIKMGISAALLASGEWAKNVIV